MVEHKYCEKCRKFTPDAEGVCGYCKQPHQKENPVNEWNNQHDEHWNRM